MGGSIGSLRSTGTLGCFARVRTTQEIVVLSNNHVLADENRNKAGGQILQPGPHDGGADPADGVATLLKSVRLKRTGSNQVDATIASIQPKIAYDPTSLTGLGKLRGLSDPFEDVGEQVAKLGRTTGLTRGVVTAFELDNLVVNFARLRAVRFDNQFEIDGLESPFSLGGDSGALIVDEKLRGVGLLFSGSDSGGKKRMGLTYANPLPVVLDALDVDLLYS